jgi:hypothetical protein
MGIGYQPSAGIPVPSCVANITAFRYFFSGISGIILIYMPLAQDRRRVSAAQML